MDDFKPLLKNLGDAVRSRRKTLRLSRRDLGQRTHISERFLADIEMGRANPSLVKLCAISRALGTSTDVLLTSLSPATAPGRNRKIIALLGLRGAGKSTVGPILAGRLGCRFLELDERIERSARLTLHEIFELHGEDYYRRQERDALASILSDRLPTVLATGGGLVTAKETFELLRNYAFTVWLKATPRDHWNRVVAQGDTRPMADDDQAFAHLRAILGERDGLYELAEVTVDTSDHAPEEIASQLAFRFTFLNSANRSSL